MSPLRGIRLGALAISVSLVIGVGGVGFAANIAAAHKAEQIQRADRLALSEKLQTLSKQFFLLAAKEENDFSSTQKWTFTRNNPGDRTRLHSFITRSSLLNYAAVIVDTQRNVLVSDAPASGLPRENDPGYNSLIEGLFRGEPGLSSVMFAGSIPVVGVAVPIMRKGSPVAIFIAYFRADQGLLQEYEKTLTLGKTGHLWVVDATGRIVGSNKTEDVGTLLSKGTRAQLKPGSPHVADYVSNDIKVVGFIGPLNLGGWYIANEQAASEFYGPIRSGALRVLLAIIGLLVVAATAIVVMNELRSRALRRAFEYKGALLANTSHELKTPLTVILGCAATLERHWRTMQPTDVDTFVLAIKRRSEDLTRLVERILLAARLEAGQPIDLNPEPVNVADTLRRIADEFKTVSERHPVTLESPPALWSLADPTALDQVVGLLAENAIKYSPDGGEIHIEAEETSDNVVVRIADHGMGISIEDQSHIFESYYRGSQDRHAPIRGAGLGLGIARYLVERQGGHITVHSTPGEGTVFEFTLPRAKSPSETPALVS